MSKYKYYKPAPPNYVGADPNMQFPPKGVPVYVDHPFFKRDELFNDSLCAAALALWAVKNTTDKSETDEMLSWLQGEIPIPENMLERMITLRAKHAKMESLTHPQTSGTNSSHCWPHPYLPKVHLYLPKVNPCGTRLFWHTT